jgi:hypothetical protein
MSRMTTQSTQSALTSPIVMITKITQEMLDRTVVTADNSYAGGISFRDGFANEGESNRRMQNPVSEHCGWSICKSSLSHRFCDGDIARFTPRIGVLCVCEDVAHCIGHFLRRRLHPRRPCTPGCRRERRRRVGTMEDRVRIGTSSVTASCLNRRCVTREG